MENIGFKINNNFTVRKVIVGNSKTPVIILDDILEDLSTLKSSVSTYSSLKEDETSYYPGVRSQLPIDYAKLIVANVYRQLYSVYNIPTNKTVQAINSVYSLITKQPEELQLNQKRPHFDTPAPNNFAILHYLNEGSYGATGFFRHKRTGLERIHEEVMNSYLAQASIDNAGSKTQLGYITESDSDYELIFKVPYKKNRLVIYPANLLHSILINGATDINEDPLSGRLTANIFIEYI